ncbi:FixH family protein [Dissulfurispira sp.]|uniref:FixH family protein n=1 Tax=Dissulfurispira sp. TaxID=2817609 RepID=UPI002FDB5D02
MVFDCNPKPVKSMSEILFGVTLREKDKPVQDASVEIYLTMPGMFMGDNRILLMHKEKGRYEGKGVIARCPSGKRIWKADVIIVHPSKKTTHASYVFEVKN